MDFVTTLHSVFPPPPLTIYFTTWDFIRGSILCALVIQPSPLHLSRSRIRQEPSICDLLGICWNGADKEKDGFQDMVCPFHARIPTPYLPRNSVWIPQNFSSYGRLLPPTFLPPLRSTDQEAVAASGATHGGWSVPDEKLDAPGSNILQNVKTLL